MSVKINDLYNSKNSVYSFEVFPVRKGESIETIFEALDNLEKYNPVFVSVTEGRTGSRKKTVGLAHAINERYDFETVVHMVLRGRSKQCIDNQVKDMKKLGLTHLLALRGDKPKPNDYYKYASDLVAHLRNGGGAGDFSIGVAGYPSMHPESKSKKDDVYYLKLKVDAGSDFIIEQMIFDSNSYFSHCNLARGVGINKLIIPGIMPIDKYSQFKFVTNILKIKIPKELNELVEENKNDDVQIANIFFEHNLNLCKELIEGGAPGIHFYIMNRSDPTIRLLNNLNN